MTATLDNTPGFFGKVPALGDFVQRQLPAAFVQTWDAWLQAGVAGSKAQLGEHWLDTYLSSPIWRFALSPGVATDQGWAGVIIPSVDRVGRYFPLAVAAPLSQDLPVFALVDADDWFGQAENVALSALEEQGFELDSFTSAVAQLGPLVLPSALSLPAEDLATVRRGWQIELADIIAAGNALQGVGQLLAKERFGKFSLWWTNGSQLVTPSLLVCPDLPDAQSYCAMLDGRWRESNWQVVGAEPEVNTNSAMVDA